MWWSKGGHEQNMQNPNPAKLFIFYARRSVLFVLIKTARKQACTKSCTHSTSAKTSLIVIFFLFSVFNLPLLWKCNLFSSDTQRRSEMQMQEDSALIKVNNYSGPVKIHWSDFSMDVPTFFSWEVMYIGHIGFFSLFFFITESHCMWIEQCERMGYNTAYWWAAFKAKLSPNAT